MCWRADTRLDERGLRQIRDAINVHVSEVVGDGDAAHAIEQIIGELIGNVQRYAPGPFCTELHWNDESVCISVHDPGPCFDSETISETSFADWEAERGRGLPIIKALGGVVQTHRADGTGCRVSVTLPVTKPNSAAPSACPHEHPAARAEHCPRIAQYISGRQRVENQSR